MAKELKFKEERSKSAFADAILNTYLKNKFGSFSKSDFEYFFIYLLGKYTNINEMSNWDAGLVLHIPDNRIRGLKYRARLKYEEYDEKDTVDEFFNLLFKGKFSVEKDKNFERYNIIMTMDDEFLQKAIEDILDTLGETTNKSLNRKHLIISDSAFAYLVETLYKDDANRQKLIKDTYKSVKKEDKSDEFSISGKIKEHIKNAATKEVVEEIVKGVVECVTSATSATALGKFLAGS